MPLISHFRYPSQLNRLTRNAMDLRVRVRVRVRVKG
jgi:hypothetical protein